MSAKDASIQLSPGEWVESILNAQADALEDAAESVANMSFTEVWSGWLKARARQVRGGHRLIPPRFVEDAERPGGGEACGKDESLEVIKRAADLIRERAGACILGPWIENEGNKIHRPSGRCVATTHPKKDDRRKGDAQHIASWHPAVALAVADWLEADAGVIEQHGLDATASKAYDVARAYLGEDPA